MKFPRFVMSCFGSMDELNKAKAKHLEEIAVNLDLFLEGLPADLGDSNLNGQRLLLQGALDELFGEDRSTRPLLKEYAGVQRISQ